MVTSSNSSWSWPRVIRFAFALLSLLLVLYTTNFLWQPIIQAEEGFYYVLKPGAPLQTLIDELANKQQLSHPWSFKLLAYLKGASRRVQAGEYFFPKNTTPNQLINILLSGHVVQHKITLIEGWTFADVYQEIQQNNNLKHELEHRGQELHLPYKNLEGVFMAETYEFPYGMSDKEFLLWSYQQMQASLKHAWENRQADLPYRTAYEAIIAASLIEKETADPNERYLIASVIVNRLRKNMYLQIDPTVIYGLYHRFIPVLSKFDLKIDTVYNTYKHKGLPPTPISLPSKASLHAALHPADTTYLFFVLKDDGKHYFSSSYQEHRKAVKKYRHIRRYKQSFREQRHG